jgi:hypothetical protein
MHPQSADDVRLIRRVLDEAGGYFVKIIAKIENEAGLRNIDEILAATDGVMVARGDLAMEVRGCSGTAAGRGGPRRGGREGRCRRAQRGEGEREGGKGG